MHCVMGDMNARVADPTSLLPPDGLYHYFEDLAVNANGHKLTALCKTCDLLVANHLVTGNTELGGGCLLGKDKTGSPKLISASHPRQC